MITLKYRDRDIYNIHNRYEILMNGIVMENAFALGDSPDNIRDIECNDPNTSRKLLNHSLSEFPVLFNGMRLQYTFEWTDIFESISIYDAREKGTLITLVAWPDLRKWKNIYSFAEYCDEMTRILNSKKLDDLEFKTIKDTGHADQYFEINFRSSSPHVPIIDDLLKWEKVIHECHMTCVDSLSAHHRVERIKFLPDKSQCCINGQWFYCHSSSGVLIVGGNRGKTSIPVNLFHDVTINDLPANSEFNLKPNKAEFEYLDWITLHKNEKIVLKIICTFNFKKWERPWNLYSFLKDMAEIFNSRCAPSAVVDLDVNESGAPIVDMHIESQHTGVNTLETWITDVFTSIKHAFEITETKYAAEDNFDFKNRIVREIEFSPEHYQAGLSILSYFGSILKQKYSDSSLKVKIIQDNMIVRMIIETPEGKREELEKTLTDYGRVINGTLAPADFLTNPIDALQLKQQLNLARVQLENQKELLSFQNQQFTSRLIGLEEEVTWLRSHIGAVMSFSGGNAAILSNVLDNVFALVGNQNQKIETALETISHKIQAGISQSDRSEIIKAFMVIKEEDEGVFKKVVGLFNELIIKGSIAGVSGNLLFEWLRSLKVI